MVSDSIYGELLGWIPGWVWIGVVMLFVAVIVWMWLRIRGSSGRRGTIQQQRDHSPQWARRRDVAGLVIDGPDSRRLPLGELITYTRKQNR